MDLPQQLKLPIRLKCEHDVNIIKQFRLLERAKKTLARYKNHLHFTLHCKHKNVFPVSLKLKTTVKGKTANRIIEKAQLALLNERIKQIHA